MKIFLYSSIVFVGLLPYSAQAQTFRKFSDVADMLVGMLTQLLPVLVSLALLVFFWGLVKYLVNAESVKGRETGREVMLWGIISLFVMVSIWGIVAFMQTALFDRVLISPNGGRGGTETGQVFYPGQGSTYPEIP